MIQLSGGRLGGGTYPGGLGRLLGMMICIAEEGSLFLDIRG